MKAVFAALKAGERRVRVAGLPVSGWGAVGAALADKADVLLVIVSGAGDVAAVVSSLKALVRKHEVVENVIVWPAWDVQPYDRLGPGPEVAGERQETLAKVQAAQENGDKLVVVTSVAALGVMEAPPSGDLWRVAVGGEVDVAELAAKLVDLGYRREDVVQEAGSFAVRGGIVDVWPAASEAGADGVVRG